MINQHRCLDFPGGMATLNNRAAKPAIKKPVPHTALRWWMSAQRCQSSRAAPDRHEPPVISLLQHRRPLSTCKQNVTVTGSSSPAAGGHEWPLRRSETQEASAEHRAALEKPDGRVWVRLSEGLRKVYLTPPENPRHNVLVASFHFAIRNKPFVQGVSRITTKPVFGVDHYRAIPAI